MIVLCVGVDHQTASLAMREPLACSVAHAEKLYLDFTAGRIIDALPVEELALLSTCNRVEVYAAVPDECATRATTDAMWSFLWRGRDDAPGTIAPHGYTFTGSHAERHLCRVAAGLESMLLGEAEVLGQIADAFALAQRARATGSTLDALFNAALRAGRRARTATSIGRNPVSVSSVAVDLAAALAPEMCGRKVLILGAGKMARIAADLLVGRGEWMICIASRTPEHARVLAERVHGYPIALEAVPNALADVDLVIACSASPTPIVSEEVVRAAMRERADRLLTIIDIAVPRDVDPAVRIIPGVRLYDVDELRPRVEESLARRREEIPAVEAIVEDEVKQLAARRRGAALLSIVDAWRGAAEDTRRREVERALGSIPNGDGAVRESLERFSVVLVKRLLDEPSRRLRAEAANGHAELYAEMARRLFAVEPGDEPPPDQPIRAKA